MTDQEIKQAPQGGKDQYFLQAGSFQNEADANNLKAKLALMGVEATINPPMCRTKAYGTGTRRPVQRYRGNE